MKKQHIIKCFLAGALIMAVGIATARSEADSLQCKAPGAMFGVSQLSNTAAISSVSGDDLYHTPAVNVSNSLVGRLAGMTLSQGSGEPGADDASWLIRGIGSHGYGGYNTCKIFVDGFEVNANYFTSLSPSEIESVSILKDGAALTIFGDRGANGVIWVQTKRGKQGSVTMSANVRSGLQMPGKINKPLDSYSYAYLRNVASSNDAGAWTPVYTNDELTDYMNGAGVDVDWYDETMKKSGYYTDGDVSLSGGNEYARYYVVLGYLRQEGLFNVKNDRDYTSNVNFQRYNLRANLDLNIGKVLEGSVDVGGKLSDNKFPRTGVYNIMNTLATYPNNVYNVWDDDDLTRWSGTSVYPDNPVAALKAQGYGLQRSRIMQANFTLKEKLDFITRGLYLYQAFSLNTTTYSSQYKSAQYERYHNGSVQTNDKQEYIRSGGWGSDGMEDWKQGMLSAGYDYLCGPHTLNVAAGAHISAFKGDGYFSFKYNYLNYRGKVHYDYDKRYAVEASLSTFGNDAYSSDNRWSVYPAISGAWILSNEAFMKNSSAINLFKIRASFGMSGSSDSEATGNLTMFGNSNGRFLYKEYYSTNNPFGSFYTGEKTPNWQQSRVPMFIPNKDARSETAYKYNFGIDLSMAKKRFNLMADLFYDRRKDILTYDQSIFYYYGLNFAILNIGEMTNRGFELMADWSDKIGDWRYALNGMVSFNRNKIIEMGEVPTKYGYNAYTGQPYGTLIGLQADGFYSPEDIDDNGVLDSDLPIPLFGNVQRGDIKYRDLDGNGFIDDDDVTKIGKSFYPEWTYGIRASVGWKGFDLDVLLQGITGASVNLLATNYEQMVPFVNDRTIYKVADNSWTYYPTLGLDNSTNATYPRLTLEANQNNHRSSSFWVKDLDYIKIRHIELGYTFKVDGMTNFRVYLNATNPFTFSKLMKDYNIDPERLGIGYPALKSYSLGVSLSF